MSFQLVAFDRTMRHYDWLTNQKSFSDYEIIFIIWAAMGSFIVLTKLILFSPKQLPEVISEEKPYSLFEHSMPLQLCCRKTPEDITEPTAGKTEEIDQGRVFKMML